MRSTTRKRIAKIRNSLTASIAGIRGSALDDDPEAQAVMLMHECLLDMVARLPLRAADRATQADAIILTRAQMREMLVCFGLDLLALDGGVRERERDDG